MTNTQNKITETLTKVNLKTENAKIKNDLKY